MKTSNKSARPQLVSLDPKLASQLRCFKFGLQLLQTLFTYYGSLKQPQEVPITLHNYRTLRSPDSSSQKV